MQTDYIHLSCLVVCLLAWEDPEGDTRERLARGFFDRLARRSLNRLARDFFGRLVRSSFNRLASRLVDVHRGIPVVRELSGRYDVETLFLASLDLLSLATLVSTILCVASALLVVPAGVAVAVDGVSVAGAAKTAFFSTSASSTASVAIATTVSASSLVATTATASAAVVVVAVATVVPVVGLVAGLAWWVCLGLAVLDLLVLHLDVVFLAHDLEVVVAVLGLGVDGQEGLEGVLVGELDEDTAFEETCRDAVGDTTHAHGLEVAVWAHEVLDVGLGLLFFVTETLDVHTAWHGGVEDDLLVLVNVHGELVAERSLASDFAVVGDTESGASLDGFEE